MKKFKWIRDRTVINPDLKPEEQLIKLKKLESDYENSDNKIMNKFFKWIKNESN